MKKEIADMWVKALRSGKYGQAQGRLAEAGNSFCCLGVLCSLAPQEVGEFIGDLFIYTNSEGNEAGEREKLPRPVREWSGVKGSYGERFTKFSLADLNDYGKTFAEIADIIESEWELL